LHVQPFVLVRLLTYEGMLYVVFQMLVCIAACKRGHALSHVKNHPCSSLVRRGPTRCFCVVPRLIRGHVRMRTDRNKDTKLDLTIAIWILSISLLLHSVVLAYARKQTCGPLYGPVFGGKVWAHSLGHTWAQSSGPPLGPVLVWIHTFAPFWA
jgi:hypothetical protein